MGVVKPGYHLASPHDLKHLRKRLKGTGGRNINPGLNLTPFIDLFSTIILFLISLFSATGDVMMSNKDIVMPNASHGKELTRAPIVTVMADKVTLEGAPVGDNANIQEKIEETDWELPQLNERLDNYKRFFESVNVDTKFPGEVIVQADKEIPFLYLKRVMFTLVKHGYPNIMLAVRGKPADGPPPAPPAAPGNPAER
jgi:biopolymer transport protein ExbD